MKTLCLVWLLGLSCGAEDLRWQRIAVERDEGEVFLDVESAQKTGDGVDFWESQRYKSTLMYNNVIYDQVDVHYEMSCGTHAIHPIAYIVKLHGNPLRNDVRSYGRMPLVSQTGVEIAYRRFCTEARQPDGR